MAIDRKYGRVNFATENNIGPDEPVFVIRAQDEVSVNALWEYLNCYVKAIGPEEQKTDASRKFAESVELAVRDFEKWQDKNETKIPD